MPSKSMFSTGPLIIKGRLYHISDSFTKSPGQLIWGCFVCLGHHLKPCYWYCKVYDVTFRLQQTNQPQGLGWYIRDFSAPPQGRCGAAILSALDIGKCVLSHTKYKPNCFGCQMQPLFGLGDMVCCCTPHTVSMRAQKHFF